MNPGGQTWHKRSMNPKSRPPREVPFVGMTIGPIIGFKVYEYKGTEGPRILSPYRTTFEWWPNRSLEKADCRVSDSHALTKTKRNIQHKVPADGHWCGFYMYYELEDAQVNALMFHSTFLEVGVFVCMVAAWGDVVHHESGTRSSNMEIVAFHDGPYDFPQGRQKLAEEMGVPYLSGKKLKDAQNLLCAGRVEEAKEKYGVFL